MTEEVLKINEDVLCRLSELDKSKVYLFQVHLEDCPKEQVINILTQMKKINEEKGITCIVSAYNDERGLIKVDELEKYLEKK